MPISAAPAAAILCLLLAAAPARAGWTTVTSMPAPQRLANGLVFADGARRLEVTALTPEIVRVRFVPRPSFPEASAGTIEPRPWPRIPLTIKVGQAESSVATSTLTVTVRHAPLLVRVATASGEVIDESAPDRAFTHDGDGASRSWRLLGSDETVAAPGPPATDLRGRVSPGQPILLVSRNGRAHGLALDSTRRSTLDAGHERKDQLGLGVDGGALDTWLIDGPTAADVVRRYRDLTGTPAPGTVPRPVEH